MCPVLALSPSFRVSPLQIKESTFNRKNDGVLHMTVRSVFKRSYSYFLLVLLWFDFRVYSSIIILCSFWNKKDAEMNPLFVLFPSLNHLNQSLVKEDFHLCLIWRLEDSNSPQSEHITNILMHIARNK